ncbi:hypothetical protein KW463_08545 [Vibrio fluvialis]|nr:hypothetical protein [Vibrio fluvialis]
MIRLTPILLTIFTISAIASEELHPPIWSQDKTAVAFCENKETSVCYVICNDEVANVSDVEKANLGKIGDYQYEKVVTYPISWESNDKFGCMFWFQTHAWINGQRHTVKEPAFVTDGEYRGR